MFVIARRPSASEGDAAISASNTEIAFPFAKALEDRSAATGNDDY